MVQDKPGSCSHVPNVSGSKYCKDEVTGVTWSWVVRVLAGGWVIIKFRNSCLEITFRIFENTGSSYNGGDWQLFSWFCTPYTQRQVLLEWRRNEMYFTLREKLAISNDGFTGIQILRILLRIATFTISTIFYIAAVTCRAMQEHKIESYAVGVLTLKNSERKLMPTSLGIRCEMNCTRSRWNVNKTNRTRVYVPPSVVTVKSEDLQPCL